MPVSFATCVDAAVQSAPEQFALCGYSMGARIALHVALTHPERVSRLVLVGVNPGIEDPAQRSQRLEADLGLARWLEQENDMETFVTRWRAQPLFARDPPGVAEAAAQDYRRNRPAGLAASLRGVGAGVMEPLWERLGELRMPVTVVAGSRDERYQQLGRRMVAGVSDGALQVLPGGHAVQLESPAPLARLLASAR